MDIRAAAHALGGDVVNRNTVLCPGPAHGKADRSLSISFDAAAPDGFLVHSFAGDDWQQCRDMVRLALGIGAFEPKGGAGRPAMTFVAAVVPSPAAVQKRAYAVSLWQETRPIRGTVAERYLGNRHVLVDEALTGKALRFHPACPFRLDSGETICLPSLIGLMRDALTDEPTGIHRTALHFDGRGKAKVAGLGNPKKMLGSAAGAVVKLSANADVSLGLHIAEGIETALAVMVMGFRPTWACLSAGGIARFPVLAAGIETLTIFADNDVSGAGSAAAQECAARWQSAGAEVLIRQPPTLGHDFADEVAA